MGETYMDALTFLSRGDYDKAMNLDPEEYETTELDYNFQSNTIGSKKAGEKNCKIIFAKLKSNEQKEQ